MAPASVPAFGSVSAEGAQLLSPGLWHEEALLLLLGAPLQEREAVQADVDAHGNTQEGVDVFELFAGQRQRDVVEPRAAIFLGYGKAEDAQLTHLVQDFGVKLALGVPFLDVRRDLARGEFARPCREVEFALAVSEKSIDLLDPLYFVRHCDQSGKAWSAVSSRKQTRV